METGTGIGECVGSRRISLSGRCWLDVFPTVFGRRPSQAEYNNGTPVSNCLTIS